MKKIKHQTLFINVLILFFTFFMGFIGSILLLNKRITETVKSLIDGTITGKQSVSLFGLNIVNFESIKNKEIYDIKIIKTGIYNYIPFIVGILFVLIVILLTLIFKRLIIKLKKIPIINCKYPSNNP